MEDFPDFVRFALGLARCWRLPNGRGPSGGSIDLRSILVVFLTFSVVSGPFGGTGERANGRMGEPTLKRTSQWDKNPQVAWYGICRYKMRHATG